MPLFRREEGGSFFLKSLAYTEDTNHYWLYMELTVYTKGHNYHHCHHHQSCWRGVLINKYILVQIPVGSLYVYVHGSPQKKVQHHKWQQCQSTIGVVLHIIGSNYILLLSCLLSLLLLLLLYVIDLQLGTSYPHKRNTYHYSSLNEFPSVTKKWAKRFTLQQQVSPLELRESCRGWVCDVPAAISLTSIFITTGLKPITP